MKKYVCGFMFSPDLREVVLVGKLRPAWQAKKLNAPGGAIEQISPNGQDELPQLALTRETFEETGVEVPLQRWQMFAVLKTPDTDSEIHFGAVRIPHLGEVRTRTDEPIFIVQVETIETDRIAIGEPTSDRGHGQRALGEVLYNIPWLVRMAKAALLGDDCQYIVGEVRVTPGPSKRGT